MPASTTVSPEDVLAAIDSVPDPEMPPVSVAQLGMVVDVRVSGGHVDVDLVATFSGCPAVDVIRADVGRAIEQLEGVASVDVRFVKHVTWTPERIREDAHAKLREFGIAPPTGGGAGPGLPVVGIARVTCPLCGSRDTVTDSPFGPTPCRSTHFCQACRNPFEAIKD